MTLHIHSDDTTKTLSISADVGSHVGVLQLDDRRRAPIGRYATREEVKGWRVFRSEDGRVLVLEAIVDE